VFASSQRCCSSSQAQRSADHAAPDAAPDADDDDDDDDVKMLLLTTGDMAASLFNITQNHDTNHQSVQPVSLVKRYSTLYAIAYMCCRRAKNPSSINYRVAQ